MSITTSYKDYLKNSEGEYKPSVAFLNYKLMDAAIDGNVDKLNDLIKHGADIDYTDDGGYTPLMRSILNNNDDIANILIDGGADVNKVANDSNTALIFALSNHLNSIALKLIVECHADIKGLDSSGNSVASIACQNGMVDVLIALLDNGVDVNIKNKLNETLLFDCLISSDNVREMVDLLIGRGIDVNAVDNFSNTAIGILHRIGIETGVGILRKMGLETNSVDDDEYQIIKSLLTAGAYLDGDDVDFSKYPDIYNKLEIQDLIASKQPRNLKPLNDAIGILPEIEEKYPVDYYGAVVVNIYSK